MKPFRVILLLLTVLPTVDAQLATLFAQSTAFTYQGRLVDAGIPANSSYDFHFTLYDDPTLGSQAGPALTNANVRVTNGLFITALDFGSAPFNGQARWLHIGVRPTGSAVAFMPLHPRQPLTPTPQALFSANAALAATATSAGGVPWSGITGTPQGLDDGDNNTTYSAGTGLSLGGTTFAIANGGVGTDQLADGAVTTAKLGDASVTSAKLGPSSVTRLKLAPDSVTGVALDTGAVRSSKIADGEIFAVDVNAGSFATTFWKTDGNSGTIPSTHFLGTTDWQPLEFKVNNARALRLESGTEGAPNVIGGWSNNFVATGVGGATIGGGGGADGAGHTNRVTGDFATVGGGLGNTGSAYSDTVGGGYDNTSSGGYATVGGGYGNSSSGNGATVGGGFLNTSSGPGASVGGGGRNTASGHYASVLGGERNVAGGAFSLAAGRRAMALHPGSFVWGDAMDADVASTGADQFVVRATGGVHLPSRTSLHFGTQTRQMLNLWSNVYGIGVQTDTLYFRSDTGFAWFRDGRHDDGPNEPGAFGSTLMTLSSSGLVVNGGFVSPSDREQKEHFAAVDCREVLANVVGLPITTWNYKQDPHTRHLGPTAQNFHAAFHVGPDDKHIATVDADGVALAAIQGLYEVVQEKDRRIETLAKRVEKLEKLLTTLMQTGGGR